MLTRRLLRAPNALAASSIVRPLSTSSPLRAPNRSPALGDITGEDSQLFNQRQKEFRDNLEAARKQKEQHDSQLATSSTYPPAASARADAQKDTQGPTSAFPSSKEQTTPVDAAGPLDASALGSLATHRSLGEARKEETENQKRGPLKSLIYGTKEGQQMDKEIEQSFSQVLARGKYVHSIVFHDVKPDKVDEYVGLVGSWYPRMAQTPENRVNLVGSWRTEVGDCDTFGMHPTPAKMTSANSTQSTSGNTRNTPGTMLHCITFNIIRSSRSLTGS